MVLRIIVCASLLLCMLPTSIKLPIRYTQQVHRRHHAIIIIPNKCFLSSTWIHWSILPRYFLFHHNNNIRPSFLVVRAFHLPPSTTTRVSKLQIHTILFTDTVTMPLVKIFARVGMQKAIPLPALQSKLCDIWGTKPETTMSRVEGSLR